MKTALRENSASNKRIIKYTTEITVCESAAQLGMLSLPGKIVKVYVL